MKVYLVTDGDYSDYEVLGVYSTPEKAEYAKQLFTADNTIGEWELDALPKHQEGMLGFRVAMRRDGSVLLVTQIPVTDYELSHPPSPFHWTPWMPAYRDADPHVIFCMHARDGKHAIKIANERRVQLIASGEWDSRCVNPEAPPTKSAETPDTRSD